MKSTLKIPTELLTSIDMMNTLFGGIAAPVLKVQQFENHRQLNARVASVKAESLKIEIRNNVLMVYYLIPLVSQEQPHHYPKVIYSKHIPYFIDRELITAVIEEKDLVVRLPFNELAGGFKKNIPIS